MLEGFRVPVCQHLGGLGYPNVGESSGQRSMAAAALAMAAAALAARN